MWEDNVKKPAIEIVDGIEELDFPDSSAFLKDEKIPSTWQVQVEPDPTLDMEWKKYLCETCNKELNGLLEWQQHLKSKQHKKSIQHKKQKLEEKQAIVKEDKDKES